MSNHFTRGMAPLAVATIVVSSAVATAAGDPPPSNGGILSGPKVEPAAQSQPDRGRPDRQDDRRDQEIPVRQWFNAVRELELTVEQRRDVRSIMTGFLQAQRDFVNSITPEERELLSKRGEADRPAKTARETREALEKLNSRRPKPEDFEQRIWEKLTDDQQAQLKEKFQAIRDEANQRQAERREDRRPPRENAAGSIPQDASDPMMQANPGDQRPATQPARNRRRAEGIVLDELAQRRLRFLLSRQSDDAANSPRHLDGEPWPADMDFRFDDGDGRNPPPRPER